MSVAEELLNMYEVPTAFSPFVLIRMSYITTLLPPATKTKKKKSQHK